MDVLAVLLVRRFRRAHGGPGVRLPRVLHHTSAISSRCRRPIVFDFSPSTPRPQTARWCHFPTVSISSTILTMWIVMGASSWCWPYVATPTHERRPSGDRLQNAVEWGL